MEKQKNYTQETIAQSKKRTIFNSVTLLIGIGIFVVAAILIVQLLYDNGVIESNRFQNNTSVNGIDVSGMNRGDAAQMISAKMLSVKDDVQVKLTYNNREWVLSGKDFMADENVVSSLTNSLRNEKQKIKLTKTSSKNKKTYGTKIDVSYRHMLKGFDEKIDEIIEEINLEPVSAKVVFNPNAEDGKMFAVSDGQQGVVVNKDVLLNTIDDAFKKSNQIQVEIPTMEIPYKNTGEDLLKNTALRSTFSTDYSSSVDGRKNNVNVALGDFNGMVIEPGQEVSFNDVTGDKTPERGYQKAKIILNGVYVDGYGGGACQASTTLYNALLLADIEILEVNPHSLPVSYVPLAFDAMVSEGYSDLRFRNNLDYPIFIKTWGDETRAYVEIYGQPLEEGLEIKRRAEFVGALPHEGDQIVKDTKGEYADKITYVGEYLRIKYPREGYHSKAYIDYYQNGELIGTKLIRDEKYYPQKGLVMEGTETLGEGMVIPENEVKIIPPQEPPELNERSVKKKVSQDNPSNLNP